MRIKYKKQLKDYHSRVDNAIKFINSLDDYLNRAPFVDDIDQSQGVLNDSHFAVIAFLNDNRLLTSGGQQIFLDILQERYNTDSFLYFTKKE